MSIEVTSPAFQQGMPIPKQYTGEVRISRRPCAGRKPPAGTKSIALICDDPDAPVAPGFIGFSSLAGADP